MKHKTIEEVIEHIKGIYGHSERCSQSEVEDIARHHSLILPDVYIEFLLNFGNGVGTYIEGDDYSLKWLKTMKKAANEILLSQGQSVLSDDTFVFWMHHGYQFCFFHCNAGDINPTVFYYNECYEKLGIVKITDTLTDFLYDPDILNEALAQLNRE